MPSFSIDALNNIRANASNEYQSRIPVATQETISQIGQAFETYTPLYNEFCDALIHRIGKTLIEQKMFKNKLARFKSGTITSAQDVQEIFVEMASAEGKFDNKGPNPFGRRNPSDVKVVYHRENRQDYYAISLDEMDFKKAFMSPALLDTFIKAQLNSVYSGDEYDEWLAMKNVLATFPNAEKNGSGYFDYMVPTGSTANFAKSFVKTLRKAVQDMSFASTQFNAAGVKTWTDPSDMVLLINKDVLVEVDVEQLASAFHQSNTDMKVVPSIVSMDDFGSLTNTYGLLVDKDWFRIYDTKFTMKQQDNAQGLFRNYFLHHHQILSASPYKNAVRFAISE